LSRSSAFAGSLGPFAKRITAVAAFPSVVTFASADLGPFDPSSIAVTTFRAFIVPPSFAIAVDRPCLTILRSFLGLPYLEQVLPFGLVVVGLHHLRQALDFRQELDHSFLLQIYNFN